MLSGLTSFLPSALQLHQEPKDLLPSPIPEEPVVTQQETDAQPQVDNMPGTKKKPKKEKTANETFIFVRPPPKMSNHPLNLQVQLVPPASRGDRVTSNPQSVDTTSSSPQDQQPIGSNGSNDLTRTTSMQSTEGSMYSGYTSNTSISSYASQASSGSGRRMIIPLYNLQAHNVMTNTVVDAGTDAKVAKFQKRGLEVLGLAILEPVEVWGNAIAVVSPSARTSIDGGNGSSISHRDREFAPAPSNISDRPASASGGGNRFRPPNILVKSTLDSSILSPNAPPPSAAKKMFGRIFKKTPSRPPSISLPTDYDSMGAPAPRSSFNIPSARLSRGFPPNIIPPASSAPLPSALSSAIETPTTSNGVRPLVLGVQPSMSSAISPPQGRPSKYVWIVRRWLKSTENGLLGGMMGKLSVSGKDALGLSMGMAGVIGQVEVEFEWSRGRTGRKRDKDKRGRPSTAHTINTESNSRRASMIVSSSKEHLGALSSRTDKDKRMSTMSQRSISTHTGTSDEHVSTANHHEDDGNESDPEDSETPWTCTISVQRVSHPTSARPSTARAPTTASSSSSSHEHHPQIVRLKVATLSPTPHHPKVVSMLKVPFPLPDIEVEKMAVQPRVLTAQGLARPGTSVGHEGLVLTAEEIKDVVSCTGLWLVVREGFGGVGKVNRKGDGWKIRG